MRESSAQGILRPRFFTDRAEIRPGSVFRVLRYAGRRETPACPAQLMKLPVISEAAGLARCGKGLSGADWLPSIWEPQDALSCRAFWLVG